MTKEVEDDYLRFVGRRISCHCVTLRLLGDPNKIDVDTLCLDAPSARSKPSFRVMSLVHHKRGGTMLHQ
jgi:hypothetical protein